MHPHQERQFNGQIVQSTDAALHLGIGVIAAAVTARLAARTAVSACSGAVGMRRARRIGRGKAA